MRWIDLLKVEPHILSSEGQECDTDEEGLYVFIYSELHLQYAYADSV